MLISPIEMIEVVADSLSDLVNEVAFVGGAVSGLYLPASLDLESRSTEDVDCVINVTTSIAYSKLENQLRDLGFKNKIESEASVICRWSINNVVVDVMPLDTKITGFKNQWYEPGLKNKIPTLLPSGKSVYIFELSYFLASKLVALYNRGGHDWRGESDLEDVLFVLVNSNNPLEIIKESEPVVRKYLTEVFSELISHADINDILVSNVQEGSFEKSKVIIEEISQLS